ncbi:L-2-hydroxyglutarate dehydrogenase, mitochondrial isoform X2 [Drosophila novamexicana]|uniref:L-2-hydroxyglutarate dehydrogenase, mitochondrial isoform X2 n=1 Tax=Drosophila novamexicana TaxID=47314 RepID=UPI0011E59F15|nr:L-2-hydroxyglutarate dehydrogenase, mitochondrial isoform X2 [Drosophila novamexicana]
MVKLLKAANAALALRFAPVAGTANNATLQTLDRQRRWQHRSAAGRGSGSGERQYDLVVVGGGIVGAASAREILLRHPALKVAILEKEPKLAMHQSGHNSGVIHAGIYYKPGTLKARLCVEGLHLAYKYLDEHQIPYKKCGKLIVATDAKEVKLLEDLHQRGIKNNVPDLRMIDGDQIKEIEPYCQGVKALHSPHTGIVDWGLVTQHYGEDFKCAGGDIYLDFKVSKFSETPEGTDYPVTIHGAKPGQTLGRHQSVRAIRCAALSGFPEDGQQVHWLRLQRNGQVGIHQSAGEGAAKVYPGYKRI